MNEENEMPKTGCVCPLAGMCHRHNVNKTPHLHKLCQNHKGYFSLWESCRGPGQNSVDCVKAEDTVKDADLSKKEISSDEPTLNQQVILQEPLQKPSLFQQAKSLAVAAKDHMLNGMRMSPPELKDKRMSICKECPLFDKESSRCKKCTCYLPVKTSLESSKCPIGLW